MAVEIIKNGKVVARSQNLRGVISYARKHLVENVSIHQGKNGDGQYHITFSDGAAVQGRFAAYSILLDWITSRAKRWDITKTESSNDHARWNANSLKKNPRRRKQRKFTPGEARAFFDRMYEATERQQQAAYEAWLKTPEGEAERQRKNAERLKKNPRRRKVSKKRAKKTSGFVICAWIGKSYLYYRASSKSIISSKAAATHYKSKAEATKVARSILGKMPAKVKYLRIEKA